MCHWGAGGEQTIWPSSGFWLLKVVPKGDPAGSCLVNQEGALSSRAPKGNGGVQGCEECNTPMMVSGGWGGPYLRASQGFLEP